MQGKLKIGQVSVMTRKQEQDLQDKGLIAPNKRVKDFLGEDGDNVYFDARPELVGELVTILKIEDDTYYLDLDGYQFTCGKESVEVIKDSKFSVMKNLTTKKTGKPRKSRIPAVNAKKNGTVVNNLNRKAQIKECQEPGCNGEPVLVPFELETCTGLRCKECWLVESYELK